MKKLVVEFEDGSEETYTSRQGFVVDMMKDRELSAPMTVRDVTDGRAILRNFGTNWYEEISRDQEDMLAYEGGHQKPIARFFFQ